jgi:hypothetical protein
MSSVDHYRMNAAMLAAEARDETHAAIRAELCSLMFVTKRHPGKSAE